MFRFGLSEIIFLLVFAGAGLVALIIFLVVHAKRRPPPNPLLACCPACGREVSTVAAQCPGCGHPRAPDR